IFGILDTRADDVMRAITSNTADFEDAVMIETAVREKVDCIVTRNTEDYRLSSVRVLTPAALIQVLTEYRSDDTE
ncbi:MAG: PIN domain-containing protein, partial [Clostridia bacterium]|nr:PIN domain-containing protein [Clostridia bacterium]